MELLTQILFTCLPFIMTIIILYLRSLHKAPEPAAPIPEATEPTHSAAPKEKKPAKAKPHTPTHPLYVSCVKGFLSAVADFDVKPGLLAACCTVRDRQDGRIRVYQGVNLRDPEMKYVQVKMEGEPSAIAVSPTGYSLLSEAVVVGNAVDKRLYLFVMQSKPQGKTLVLNHRFEGKHFHSIKSLAMTEAFIVSCAEEEHTEVVFWSYDGTILHKYDTNQIKNRVMTVSANFKLLTVAAWLSDARVVEIQYEKNSGSFKGAKPVMALKGHTQGLTGVAFDEAAAYAVTSSKDGTVRVWRTDVRYEVNEDPKLLQNLVLGPDMQTAEAVAIGSSALALACKGVLELREKLTGKIIARVEDAHTGDIAKMRFIREREEEFLLTVATDAKINIWHVPSSS